MYDFCYAVSHRDSVLAKVERRSMAREKKEKETVVEVYRRYEIRQSLKEEYKDEKVSY